MPHAVRTGHRIRWIVLGCKNPSKNVIGWLKGICTASQTTQASQAAS